MTVWLARHGAHATVDSVLLGRIDDKGLSELGFAQAQALSARLEGAGITRVETSPRRRCRETAMIVATALGLPLRVAPELDEVDFGRWSGRRFEDLAHDEHWSRWNRQRGSVRAPGGETMTEARQRIMNYLRANGAATAQRPVLLVSHAELIRAAILTRQARSLDQWQTVDVPTGGLFAIEEHELGLELSS